MLYHVTAIKSSPVHHPWCSFYSTFCPLRSVEIYSESSKRFKGLDTFIANRFLCYSDPIWIYIGLWINCLVKQERKTCIIKPVFAPPPPPPPPLRAQTIKVTVHLFLLYVLLDERLSIDLTFTVAKLNARISYFIFFSYFHGHFIQCH